MSDRYEIQPTEELQSITQAFGIGKKEQFAFWTDPNMWPQRDKTNKSRNSSDLILPKSIPSVLFPTNKSLPLSKDAFRTQICFY